MGVDCNEKKLKIFCRGVSPGKFWNKKTHLIKYTPIVHDKYINFSLLKGCSWNNHPYPFQIKVLSVSRKIGTITKENHCILIDISCVNIFKSNIYTVETPYNTAPYITGSNIARLGHGSQNSWSKLWIPFVKSAPVRVIFTWKSVPKKSIHGSSDIYLGTRWKQWHDSPWSYRSDVIVTFLCYGTIGIIWRRDHQSTAKEV